MTLRTHEKTAGGKEGKEREWKLAPKPERSRGEEHFKRQNKRISPQDARLLQ